MSENKTRTNGSSSTLKSVNIAYYYYCYCCYGAVLPRRRPHHVLILSVRLFVYLFIPCLHLEGKRKGLRIPNLVGRVPGTPAPRGPISRLRGQRSRSRWLIALLAKNPHNFSACCPINLLWGMASCSANEFTDSHISLQLFLFFVCHSITFMHRTQTVWQFSMQFDIYVIACLFLCKISQKVNSEICAEIYSLE